MSLVSTNVKFFFWHRGFSLLFSISDSTSLLLFLLFPRWRIKHVQDVMLRKNAACPNSGFSSWGSGGRWVRDLVHFERRNKWQVWIARLGRSAMSVGDSTDPFFSRAWHEWATTVRESDCSMLGWSDEAFKCHRPILCPGLQECATSSSYEILFCQDIYGLKRDSLEGYLCILKGPKIWSSGQHLIAR